MESSIAIDIVAVGVAIASLFFTIFSFIIVCVSLWQMVIIAKNTKNDSKERAKIEDESNIKRDEKLDKLIENTNKNSEDLEFDLEKNSKLPNTAINITNVIGNNNIIEDNNK